MRVVCGVCFSHSVGLVRYLFQWNASDYTANDYLPSIRLVVLYRFARIMYFYLVSVIHLVLVDVT